MNQVPVRIEKSWLGPLLEATGPPRHAEEGSRLQSFPPGQDDHVDHDHPEVAGGEAVCQPGGEEEPGGEGDQGGGGTGEQD